MGLKWVHDERYEESLKITDDLTILIFHHHARGRVMDCKELGFDTVALQCSDLEDAKSEAEDMVLNRLHRLNGIIPLAIAAIKQHIEG